MEKQQTKIKVAIIGVGSCASALIQGVQYYKDNDTTVGLMYPDIGGYTVDDIEFVLGFDIDERKINKPLSEAIYSKPNCCMKMVDRIDEETVPKQAMVFQGLRFDGVSEHMLEYPEDVTFKPAPELQLTEEEFKKEYIEKLFEFEVDVVINYLPVGSDYASAFYVERAIEAGCSVVNCMPSFIDVNEAKALEQKAINYNTTIIGSDMKSAFGASRLSEIIQSALLDAGLNITQHIQENKACGSTQGEENVQYGRTANTDFLNMANQERLHNKHISKENVLKGQNVIRDVSTAGKTLYAGPSLTVLQKPGGKYIGSDNKVANIDIIAFGFGGARYELTARLSVQDSPNSGGVVISAIRFCQVAKELGIRGFLRGPSAYTQKTPPLQLTSEEAKYECDMLAKRQLTDITKKQTYSVINVNDLEYTFQIGETDYEAN